MLFTKAMGGGGAPPAMWGNSVVAVICRPGQTIRNAVTEVGALEAGRWGDRLLE